jgi:hypothetical protein
MVHKSFKNSESNSYSPACTGCYTTNVARDGEIDFNDPGSWVGRDWIACSQCTVQCIRARGDPTYDKKCDVAFKQVQGTLKAKHTVKGALHMTVKQVRQLRDYILGKGTKRAFKFLQLWVMILLGIRCLLRADEIVSVCLEQFRTQSAVVHLEHPRIDELVVKVQGKCDDEPVWLSIFRDDENPEFCLVRLIMVYLGTSKIEDGFLFPDPEELMENLKSENPNPKTSFESHITYYKLLELIKVSQKREQKSINTFRNATHSIFLMYNRVLF